MAKKLSAKTIFRAKHSEAHDRYNIFKGSNEILKKIWWSEKFLKNFQASVLAEQHVQMGFQHGQKRGNCSPNDENTALFIPFVDTIVLAKSLLIKLIL